MGKSSPQTFETAFATYGKVGVLGEGGSGTVFRVEDESGDAYALKCLDPAKLTPQRTKRFKNELLFCLKNEHKNIVKVLDWGYAVREERKCPFYVMPLLPSTLRKQMEQGIPPEKVLHHYSHILDGVEAAHLHGIWHRDLKPENILVDESSDLLVVADFGIAHFSDDELHTAVETNDRERLANFQYSAPEQRARGQAVDYRADIFALGLILSEMFTGAVPHGTRYKRISEVASGYGYLDDLIEHMLTQSPDGRPDSIDAIKQQLIARKNEFVSRQKLSELNKTVISAQAIDDPLVVDPVRVVGLDYEGTRLIIVLSQKVNQTWIDSFRKAPVLYYQNGEQPDSFHFNEDRAIVSIADKPDQFAQQLLNRFKQYLAHANDDYARQIKKNLERQEEMERQRLRREIEEQERRQRILKNVKI